MEYAGSCHCGRIAFELEADIKEVADCNCSLCRRRGGLLWFGSRDALTLKTPASDLSTYTFNTHRLRHQFCPLCGISPFCRGIDKEGNETFAINVRCLEGVDPHALEIQSFDGRSL